MRGGKASFAPKKAAALSLSMKRRITIKSGRSTPPPSAPSPGMLPAKLKLNDSLRIKAPKVPVRRPR